MSDSASQIPAQSPGNMPTKIGRYAILRKLGQGGMGAVYEAEHTKLKKRVALKVLPPEVSNDPAAVARFEREMKAVGRVTHPGIIQALDADEADGVAYLAMELVDGQDVSEVAGFYEKQAGKPMSISVACEIIRQASLALQAAHDAGLVHRDMKPSNLMLSRDGTVKVLDLGLALLDAKHSDGGPLTSTGQVMGTVDYMAPEQAAETHSVDARADVYSLGATLYRLIGGKAPYPGERFSSVLQKLMALANAEPTPLRELRPKCPAKLADVVAKAMAKNVDARISSAAELARILEPACDAAKLQELASLIPERPPVELAAIEATSAMPAPTEPRMSADPTVDTDGSPEATFIAKQAREITDAGSFDATFVSPALSGDQTVASQRAGVRGKNAKSKSPIKAILVGGVALAAVALAVTFLRSDTTGTITFKVPADFPGTASLRIHSDALVVADNVKVSAAQPEVALPDVPTGRVRIRLTGGDAPAYEIDPTEFRLGNSQNQFVELTAVQPKGLLLDGQDDLVTFDPVDWSVREFTVEAFVTSHPGGGSGVPVTLSDDAGTYFFLYDGDNATNKPRTAGFLCKYRGGENTSFAESEVFQPGIRQHRALSFDGRSLHYFVDGQRVNTHELNDGVIDPIAFKKLQLGRRDGEGAKHFSGLIDDLRISSTARYLKDFEPPSQLATDNQTLAFYPFDSFEDLLATDATGNGYDGQLVGFDSAALGITDKSSQYDLAGVDLSSITQTGLRFENPQAAVKVAKPIDLDLTQPFTMELWCTPANRPGPQQLHSLSAVNLGPFALTRTQSFVKPDRWECLVSTRKPGDVCFEKNRSLFLSQGVAIEPTLQHVVAQWTGEAVEMFLNGQPLRVTTSHKRNGEILEKDEEVTAAELVAAFNTPNLQIGSHSLPGTKRDYLSSAFNGNIHEVRITKGLRYSEPFVPAALTSDAQTVALYKFSEPAAQSVQDLTGNGHDGQAINIGPREGSATPFDIFAGAGTHHLIFDQPDAYVDAGEIDIDLTKPFTFEFWCQTPTRRQWQTYWNRIGILGTVGPFSVKAHPNLGVGFDWTYVAPQSETGSGYSGLFTHTSGSPSDSLWTHLALQWTGEQIELYVDGLLYTDETHGWGPANLQDMDPVEAVKRIISNSPATRVTVGRPSDPTDPLAEHDPFLGAIRQFRVSSTSRYQNPFQPKPFEADANTELFYDFSTDTGSTVPDLSGNGNDGTINLARWVPPLHRQTPIDSSTPPNDIALAFKKPTSYIDCGLIPIDQREPFTAEFWCRPQDLRSPADGVINEYQFLFELGVFDFCVMRHSNAANSDWRFMINRPGQGADAGGFTHVAGTVVPDQLVHVAAQWTGQRFEVFFDGKKASLNLHSWGNHEDDPASLVEAISDDFATTGLRLGARTFDNLSSIDHFGGEVQQFRLSNTRRYTSDFTPSETFSSDADTVILYHLTEGHGNTAHDLSGNNYDGQIIGAEWVAEEATSNIANNGSLTSSGLRFHTNDSCADHGSVPLDLTKPFTVETWCELQEIRNGDLENSFQHVVTLGPYRLRVDAGKPSGAIYSFSTQADGKQQFVKVESASPPSTNRRTHLVGQWTGKKLELYIDGVRQAGNESAFGIADTPREDWITEVAARDSHQRFSIGNFLNPLGQSNPDIRYDFGGVVYQVRVSQGVRYTDSFSPTNLASDSNTVALYNFREGSGDTLRDSSGNGHDGKIVGAEWVLTNGSPPPPAIAPFDEAQAKAHQKAWADHLGVPVEYTNSIGMKFVLIPPSRFSMGSAIAEVNKILEDAWRENPDWRVPIASEAPQHDVVLSNPFFLGMHEVTQEQYERIMGINPSHFSANSKGRSAVAGIDTSRFPVDQASWNDARLFCRMLAKAENVEESTDYRLPTEAEWEAACRAGTTSRFCSGDTEAALSQVAWWTANSGQRPHPVGELKSNPYGLFDMLGNQWEWVEDSWSPDYFKQFEGTPAIDPVGATTSDGLKILRGGVWSDPAFRSIASARRGEADFARALWYGFRVAMSVDAVKQLLSTATDQ